MRHRRACGPARRLQLFHLDYNGRPHYTGHPHIIRISPKGRSIRRVLDTHELYWAFNQIADLQ